jgi:hypothetical protein
MFHERLLESCEGHLAERDLLSQVARQGLDGGLALGKRELLTERGLGSKDALSVDHDAGWRIAIPDNRRVVSPACSLLTTEATTTLLATEATALLTTEATTTTLLAAKATALLTTAAYLLTADNP